MPRNAAIGGTGLALAIALAAWFLVQQSVVPSAPPEQPDFKFEVKAPGDVSSELIEVSNLARRAETADVPSDPVELPAPPDFDKGILDDEGVTLVSAQDSEAYRQLHEGDSLEELRSVYFEIFKEVPAVIVNDVHLQQLRSGEFEEIQGPTESKGYTISSSDRETAVPFLVANHIQPDGSTRRTNAPPEEFGGYSEPVRHAIWLADELKRRKR